MAKPDWGELQQRFLSDHAATGVSPKDWCEAQGLNYATARRYIKKPTAQTAQKPAQKKLRTAQKEKCAEELVDSKLSPKVKRFIAEYLKDNNATAAAERAGYSDPNYGRQLLTNPNVAQAIAQQQKASIVRTLGSADEVLEQMWRLATFDANQLSQYRRGSCRYCWGFGVRFIRKHFNVVLERTVRELRGEPCLELEEFAPVKQEIVCSLSFGERITTYEQMRQAICSYAARGAEKLRGEHQYCRHISAFVKTSPFALNEKYYGNSGSIKLLTPTQDSRDIINAAVKCLDAIWVDGHRYQKAGIMLGDFYSQGVAQLNLFDDNAPRQNSEKLMEVLDHLNAKDGRGTLYFAGQGIQTTWQMKREMLSPRYTTRFCDLLKVR
ncbi:DinB/UmuC family translesion DNA polymerase [Klebsiella aerogenes]|nr:DUF4113 domain-containing protein [Klebsiella aerogenes]